MTMIMMAGMLNSCNGSSFQVSCLRFINTFTRTASSARQQVQIQCELEEAGFDIPFLKMINAKVSRNIYYICKLMLTVDMMMLFCRMELPTHSSRRR